MHVQLTKRETAVIVCAGAAVAAGYAVSVFYLQRRRLKQRAPAAGAADADRSTTSSTGGGAAAYETQKAVHEYLQFHYGKAEEVLPYEFGPREALTFTARVAALAERFCDALKDFTGERPPAKALDLGCATGGAAFELARAFPHVLGVDYSHAFVEAAQDLQKTGAMPYTAVEEGDLTAVRLAQVPPDVDRSRVKFMQGDACNLRSSLVQFDAVVAANLLCRLPQPAVLLARLPSLVAPGGCAVLVSPYSWLEAWTPRATWLGGYYQDGMVPVRTAAALKQAMEGAFELVHEESIPFLIREHARKFQYGVSHATVWRRRAGAPAAPPQPQPQPQQQPGPS